MSEHSGQGAGRITLWAVEIFAAVIEEGSLSGAARRLGVGTSTVSQHLSNLETALGVELVDRSVRPVALTLAGRLFHARARSILSEAGDARAELAAHDLTRLRRLRLGMIEDFDAHVTPRLLAMMGDELTDCHFQLETGPSHRLIDNLEARALDVIVAADIGAPEGGMEVHALLREPFVLVVPAGYLAGVADVPALLAARPMIHYTQRHVMGRQIAAHLRRQGLAPPRRFELDSYSAVMAMVAAGAGWTVMTPLGSFSARRFEAAVEVHPLPFAPLARSISLTARARVLDQMPAQMARRMRGLLGELVVAPAVARLPWLAPDLRVLG